MGSFIDLKGKRFGRLTVLNRAPNRVNKNHKSLVYWNCKCDCGNYKEIKGESLRNGSIRSCGCLNKEIVSNNNRKYKKKYNTYDLSGEYGIGYTSTGKFFYFDKEDFDKIKEYCWSIDTEGYVIANTDFINKKHSTIKMHRLVMNCPPLYKVDHINHNKYDNRKQELRICTNQQNCMNRKIQCNNTSGTPGVNYNKELKKWIARIWFNNKTIYLGYFDNKEDAIIKRKEAEDYYYKNFKFQK